MKAKALDVLLSWIFQTECLACGMPGVEQALCGPCGNVPALGPSQCGRCGEQTPQPIRRCGRCEGPEGRRSALKLSRSLLRLTPGAKAVLHQVKYGGRSEYLSLFREKAAGELPPGLPDDGVLIPVPMHPGKLVARGHNPAQRIAGWIAASRGVEVLSGKLSKVVPSVPQATLSRRMRLGNLKGSFRWTARERPPRRVILVDDVFTTGATLEACARALRRAGCGEVYGLTLFRTPRVAQPETPDTGA